MREYTSNRAIDAVSNGKNIMSSTCDFIRRRDINPSRKNTFEENRRENERSVRSLFLTPNRSMKAPMQRAIANSWMDALNFQSPSLNP
ncbi:MAG: hypothetical protein FGF53_06170 [Candidatus Brockarchaeota archaeon]|nr:hypothetical protein [Candidatus Brockarchaeota archaeon]